MVNEMEKARFYCDLAQERLQSQEKLNVEHGTKAYWVLSLSVAVLAAGALIFRILWVFPLDTIEAIIVYVPGILALAAMCGAMLISVRSIYLNPRWQAGPDLEDVRKVMSDTAHLELLQEVGDTFVESSTLNGQILEDRAGLLRIALWFLVAEILFVMGLGVVTALVLLGKLHLG